MAKLVYQVYAEALFEVAVEADKLDEYKKELEFVVECFDEYPKFYDLFVAVRISKENKKDTINEIFENKISKDVLNFLKILIDKQRASSIRGIYRSFSLMVDQKQGIVNAKVQSAVELTESEKEKLKSQLENMSGHTVRLNCVVNPEIIGGLIIKMGDEVIDASITGKLNEMKDNLSAIMV